MSPVLGLVVAALVLAIASAAGLVWRARYGRLRGGSGRLSTGGDLVPAGLAPSGAAVTLLQFSSVQCAPCRQVRAVCAEVAGDVDGVEHIEVDVDEHLDAVRALDIWRLPTLLVVDRSGHVVRRTVGVPGRAALAATVTEVMAEMRAAV